MQRRGSVERASAPSSWLARSRPALACAALMTLSGVAAAQHVVPPRAPPWVGLGDVALPDGAESARVLKADQPILAAPFGDAPRRGSAARDARLPIFATRGGAGCEGRWLEVGPFAWVCDDAVELSQLRALPADARTIRDAPDGLPYRYFFVGPDGSFGYARIEDADVGEPDMQLESGFAVAIVEERLEGGVRYGRTQNGLWLPMRDLGPARPFAFRGEEIPAGASIVPFAWVIADKARVRSKTGASTDESRARFELVPFLEEAAAPSGKLVRVSETGFLQATDVRHPVLAEPPPEVNVEAGERWIDVDVRTQTLIAYEGRKPVFTTLVSTGKGSEASTTATPKGTHRIWIKLLSSNMDNLEDENAARYYRMETVPFVQYFSKGAGLHGAFWHRSFGRARSHGCVNLAPLDAQRLFGWTSPRMPAGWTAVLPTAHEPGTVIRVR